MKRIKLHENLLVPFLNISKKDLTLSHACTKAPPWAVWPFLLPGTLGSTSSKADKTSWSASKSKGASWSRALPDEPESCLKAMISLAAHSRHSSPESLFAGDTALNVLCVADVVEFFAGLVGGLESHESLCSKATRKERLLIEEVFRPCSVRIWCKCFMASLNWWGQLTGLQIDGVFFLEQWQQLLLESVGPPMSHACLWTTLQKVSECVGMRLNQMYTPLSVDLLGGLVQLAPIELLIVLAVILENLSRSCQFPRVVAKEVESELVLGVLKFDGLEELAGLSTLALGGLQWRTHETF
ncbi:hypothetical protein KCV06_g340, partial [Aureobasidium melanogenum]